MSTWPTQPSDLGDQLLRTDPVLQALTRALRRRQQRLKKSVRIEQYRLYLLIEETTNARQLELIERVYAIARSRARR